jgi:ankyrin repeat protein
MNNEMLIDDLLTKATLHNNLEDVKLALEKGAKINVIKFEPIKNAINHNNMKIMDLLIGSLKHNEDNRTFIAVCSGIAEWCVYKNSPDALEVLLNHGLPIDSCQEALNIAIDGANVVICEFLLSKGITISYSNDYAFRLAVINKDINIIDLLITATNDKERFASHIVYHAVQTSNVELFHYALKYTSNISINDDEPLAIAVVKDDTDMTKALLDAGADYRSRNYQSVKNAIANNNTQILECFLERGLPLEKIIEYKAPEIELWLNAQLLSVKLECDLANSNNKNKKHKV